MEKLCSFYYNAQKLTKRQEYCSITIDLKPDCIKPKTIVIDSKKP